MGRAPCCDKANVKKGPWSPEEDAKLKEYIEKNGTGGNWIALPQKAGLKRCGKSCRLRWLNYLRPNIKHGEFSEDEDRVICSLYTTIGSRWSIIAAQLPGRTDNDIKNYWNTKLKKKLMGIVPPTQRKILNQNCGFSSSSSSSPSSSSLSYNYTPGNPNFYTPNFPIPTLSNLQSQESFLGPNGLMMFGNETSTSSDASFNNNNNDNNNNQMGHHQSQEMGMNSCFFNGVEEDQKFMISASNGLWGNDQAPLDYGFEEIKQLISSSSCNSFLFDEIKTEENVIYY